LLPTSQSPKTTARERERERMVGPQYDLVGNPLGAVRTTFEKAAAAAAAESGGRDPVAAFRSKDWGASEVFRSFLFDQGGIDKVYNPIIFSLPRHVLR
jgi:hypothetical protein